MEFSCILRVCVSSGMKQSFITKQNEDSVILSSIRVRPLKRYRFTKFRFPSRPTSIAFVLCSADAASSVLYFVAMTETSVYCAVRAKVFLGDSFSVFLKTWLRVSIWNETCCSKLFYVFLKFVWCRPGASSEFRVALFVGSVSAYVSNRNPHSECR
jgi:hypothetical protein